MGLLTKWHFMTPLRNYCGGRDMRTYRKIKSGQPGTKKLLDIYGEKLVCVRYRNDVEQQKRYKTVEIIIEESNWNPKATNYQANEIVYVSVDRVELNEIALRQKVRLADAAWNSKLRKWEMRYDQAVQLGLEARIERRKVRLSTRPLQYQKRRMQSNTWITIFLIISHTIFFHNAANAQESPEKCAQIQYSKPNKDAMLYQVERIEGQAVFASVSQKEEFPAGGVCLVLFNEKDKQPVEVTTTNDTGQFELPDVAPGKYTLIASVVKEELHKIVLPIRLYSTKGKGSRRQGILLHMRSKNDMPNPRCARAAQAACHMNFG